MGMDGIDRRAIGVTVIKAVAITPGVVNTGHLLGSGASSICRIVKEVGPSVAIASKVTAHLGVALGSIGVLVDIIIGTMALVNIVNKTKCPESKVLTRNIEKAREIVRNIQAYYDHLDQEPEELFRQADKAIACKQEQQAIEQLKQENINLKTAITELEQRNESLKVEMREQQLQFEQKFKEEQEKQQRVIQQMQQQMQQLLQQQMQLVSQQ